MGEKNNKTASVAVEVGVPPGCSWSLEARGHGPQRQTHGPRAGEALRVIPSPPSGLVNANGNVLFLFPHIGRH